MARQRAPLPESHGLDDIAGARGASLSLPAGRQQDFIAKEYSFRTQSDGAESQAEEDFEDCIAAGQQLPHGDQHGRLPARVLRAGLAFIFVQQAAENAIASWAFTFASTNLGLSSRLAALLPSTFYFTFTAMRVVIIPLTSRLAPSTIAQAGVAVILAGSLLFAASARGYSAAAAGGATAEELMWYFRAMLASLAMLGAGTSPQFACLLASMRQHGKLAPQEHGWYNTSRALGQTLGMWLPGLIRLPQAELAWSVAMWLILSSHVRDFPWRAPPPVPAPAGKVGVTA